MQKLTSSLSLIGCAAALWPAQASDNTPLKPYGQANLLPAPQEFVVTPWYIYTRWQRYYDRNGQPVSIEYVNNDDYEINDGMVNLEYGLAQDMALDLTLGVVSGATRFANPTHEADTTDGAMDTRVGLRYRVLDEAQTKDAWTPTMTFRVGAIIEGTYDSDFVFSPGYGASGFETSLLVNKGIGKKGFGLFGDLGFRWQNHEVAEQVFGGVGAYQNLKFVRLTGAYRALYSFYGDDVTWSNPNVPHTLIYPPYQAPDDPPYFASGSTVQYSRKVQEVSHAVEGSVMVTDKGSRQYVFYMDWTFAGRNTPERLTYGLYVSFPIGGRY